jgi:hypothetical protein
LSIEVVSANPSPKSVEVKASNGVASVAKVEEKKSVAPVKAEAETADNSDESDHEEANDLEDGDVKESNGQDEEEVEAKAEDTRGVRKRIDKLRGRISEKDLRIQALERELQAKSRGPAEEPSQKPVETKPDAIAEGAPNPEDFETVADYVRAQTKFELKTEREETAKQAKEAELKAEQSKRVETFQSQVKEFAQAHDDFEDVLADVDDIPMSITVQNVILQATNGPELMYELAKNREEYERICRMPAIDAARAIGRIEARLEKQAAQSQEPKTEIKKSNAPKPITPLKANGKATKSLSDLDYEDYKRARMAEQKRK